VITSVDFKNFKVLRNTSLPLARFTLILGPNGSGKSTALQGLQLLSSATSFRRETLVSIKASDNEPVTITANWDEGFKAAATWHSNGSVEFAFQDRSGRRHDPQERAVNSLFRRLQKLRIYSLDPQAIAADVVLSPRIELGPQGSHLAGVLDRLRDEHPERFEALNDELGRWLPEFDRILFGTPNQGTRTFILRTRRDRYGISARDLSHGTLLALAILTLAHVDEPPPIVCLEESDRGIHPRLLRDVRDAMYRLSHPEQFGDKARLPTQVIATTHSPYLLDLYRDHPEEIVLAHKESTGARFERLADREELKEVLKDTHLGDAWFSGALGGVPLEE